jgi:hypothetical protein
MTSYQAGEARNRAPRKAGAPPAGASVTEESPALYSEESERAVLAALLIDAERYMPVVAEVLTPEDFHFERHGRLWAAALELAGEGLPVDLRTMQAKLERDGALESVGGLPYLATLDVDLPHLGRVATYADIVAERSRRRQRLDLLRRAHEAEASGLDASALLAQAAALTGAAAASEPAIERYSGMPTEALPEPIRSLAIDGAAAIGCDPSYIALPALAAAASAIGSTRRIRLKGSWTEPAILWSVIVGDSGARKSPALDLALGPVRERQRDAWRDHEAAMREWEAAGREGPAPVPVLPVTADATVEALARILGDQPRGILLAREELAGWLGAFDRYAGGKGSDAQSWIELHGGRPLRVDRRGGGSLYVPEAAVSVTGTIQPGTLRRALTAEHRESGLAARLLLAWPPSRPRRWTDDEIPQHVADKWSETMARLYDLTGDDDGKPVACRMSHDARAAWARWVDDHGIESADLSGDLAAVASKTEGYAARLALVVHLVRWAAGAEVDSVEVAAASIEAGVALARWSEAEARRIYAALGENDAQRDQRMMLDWMHRRGEPVTVRDAQRTGPTPLRRAGAADTVLRALARAGLVETVERSGRRGPATDVYRVAGSATHATCDRFPEPTSGDDHRKGDSGDAAGKPVACRTCREEFDTGEEVPL